MEEADLYADGDVTYADVCLDGVRETWQIRSSSAKRWLRGLFYDRSGKGAPQEAVNHAVDNLDAQASRSVQRKVYSDPPKTMTACMLILETPIDWQ